MTKQKDHSITLEYKSGEELRIKKAELLLSGKEHPPYEGALSLELEGENGKEPQTSTITIYIPGLFEKLGKEGREQLQKALSNYIKDMHDV